ncbi:unnamed protein product [Bursaphelenchus okinawaensis]|uniref:G_PROTEIN_RECEP_F1_2 domain-containing protein n=1 Tax=Bursaphelenchus okinawaensis TaxID=465554 RepID=A0A811L8M8_9BILA|nr:unnamed protein product [Bursaphelenchus okinawaensis]CAG9119315.1 unnamed protein product [Bursaphelenchus okinawaensis]
MWTNIAMRTAYSYFTVAGTTCGFSLNLLLFYVIRKTRNKTQAHTFMTYVVALQDLFYTFTELFIQHEIHLHDGSIYFYTHGIEQYLPVGCRPFILTVHMTFVFQSMFGMVCIFYYRHILLRDPSTPLLLFLKIVATGFCFSLLAGVTSAVASVSSGKELPNNINKHLVFSNGYVVTDLPIYFIYVYNNEAIIFMTSSIITLATGHIIAIVCFLLSLYAANLNRDKVSYRTRRLQLQFSRNLIAQTIGILITVTTPMFTILVAMYRETKIQYLGFCIYAPLAWHSCISALLSITFIKAYRQKILDLIGLKHRFFQETTTYVQQFSTQLTKSNH